MKSFVGARNSIDLTKLAFPAKQNRLTQLHSIDLEERDLRISHLQLTAKEVQLIVTAVPENSLTTTRASHRIASQTLGSSIFQPLKHSTSSIGSSNVSG